MAYLWGSAAIRFQKGLKQLGFLLLLLRFSSMILEKTRLEMGHGQKKSRLKEIYPLPQGYNTCDFFVLYGRYNEADHSIVTDPKGLSTVVTDDDKLHIFPLDTDKHPLGIYLTDQSLIR